MIHPATELRFISPEIGYGVFATEPIPMGTVVWTLCRFDIILTPSDLENLPEAYRPIVNKYAYSDGSGAQILCWDLGRYINHNCEPTMLGVGNEFEIAVRDLAPGDELTCDYATLDLDEAMQCLCGAPGCTGSVDNAQLLERYGRHDERVARALPLARQVAQPLLPFAAVPERFWTWADGLAPVPSHRSFFQRKGL